MVRHGRQGGWLDRMRKLIAQRIGLGLLTLLVRPC